jgi:DNA-binding MarR family transcriptional regulator
MATKIQDTVIALEKIVYANRENLVEKMWRHGKGELFILKYLNDAADAVNPSDISSAMHTTTARVSAALGVLEKKEQIYREIDKSNRRNILVSITEKGRKRVDVDSAALRKQLTYVLSEMGEDDAAIFVRLLARFFKLSDQVFDSVKN